MSDTGGGDRLMASRELFEIPGLPAPAEAIADPKDADVDDLRLRLLLAAWRKIAFAKNRLPRMDELPAAALQAVEPYLVVLENRDGSDLRFIRYGSAVAAAFGRDMVGCSARDLPSADARFFFTIYGRSMRERVPYLTRHRPSHAVAVGRWLRLVLPFDQAGAGRITHFFACNVPIDVASGFPDF